MLFQPCCVGAFSTLLRGLRNTWVEQNIGRNACVYKKDHGNIKVVFDSWSEKRLVG